MPYQQHGIPKNDSGCDPGEDHEHPGGEYGRKPENPCWPRRSLIRSPRRAAIGAMKLDAIRARATVGARIQQGEAFGAHGSPQRVQSLWRQQRIPLRRKLATSAWGTGRGQTLMTIELRESSLGKGSDPGAYFPGRNVDYLSRSIAARANSSQRSFSGCPAWPLTH